MQVNMSQQSVSDPQARDCRHANNIIRRPKRHHDMVLRTLPIPLKGIRLVMHTGGAFHCAHGRDSQDGFFGNMESAGSAQLQDETSGVQLSAARPRSCVLATNHGELPTFQMRAVAESGHAGAFRSFSRAGIQYYDWRRQDFVLLDG